MTREEKILMAIDKGYTCNPETGEVFGIKGGVLKNKLNGYIHIGIRDDNKKYYHLYAHQFIWYDVYKEIVDCIDHINTTRDDNRIDNLRSVTKHQNQFNRNAKGYSWHKLKNKWLSSIKINGKNEHLGYFLTEQEASQAYQDAKKIYHII
jgi:hypothetical protein